MAPAQQPPFRPRRRPTVLYRQVGSGVVVLDSETESGHALESGAAAVWLYCDGVRDRRALAADTGLDLDEVDRSLVALTKANLVVASDGRSISRRAMLAAGAGAGAALVTTIALPTAAMAASGTPAPLTKSAANSGGTIEPATGVSKSVSPASSAPATPHSQLAFTGPNLATGFELGLGLAVAGGAVVAATKRRAGPDERAVTSTDD